MKISRPKTEVMVLSKEHQDLNISIGDQYLMQTNCFKYLGVIFSAENEMLVELNMITKFNGTLTVIHYILVLKTDIYHLE